MVMGFGFRQSPPTAICPEQVNFVDGFRLHPNGASEGDPDVGKQLAREIVKQHFAGQRPSSMINWQPVASHADLRWHASLATTVADADGPSQ